MTGARPQIPELAFYWITVANPDRIRPYIRSPGNQDPSRFRWVDAARDSWMIPPIRYKLQAYGLRAADAEYADESG